MLLDSYCCDLVLNITNLRRRDVYEGLVSFATNEFPTFMHQERSHPLGPMSFSQPLCATRVPILERKFGHGPEAA